MLQPICDLCKEPISDLFGIVVHKPESDSDCYLSMTVKNENTEVTVDVRARYGMHICPKCLIKAVMELGKEG